MTEILDAARVEAFGDRMLEALNDAALVLLTSFGQRTALFDAMAELAPSTSVQIADQAGLQERYVREWLGGMVVSDVVEYDPGEGTYTLPPEHAGALTRAAGPNNMGALAAYVPVLASVEDEVAECFRTGGGVPYSCYPRLQEVMADDTGAVFDAIHDQAEPAKLLRAIAVALTREGTFLMVDIAASSKLEDNVDHPLGPTLYMFSRLALHDRLTRAGRARPRHGLGRAEGARDAW